MRKFLSVVLSVSLVIGTLSSLVSCAANGGELKIGTTANITGDFTPWWTDTQGDREVASLIEGYATVAAGDKGEFIMNPQIVTKLDETVNADGTRTYTVSFAEDLRFSDGTPITAAHYAAWILLFSSPVIVSCGGSGTAGKHFVGWEEYLKGDVNTFSGVRLLGPHRLSLTVRAEDSVNYYGLYTILIHPLPIHVWLPEDVSVTDEGTGAMLTGNFDYASCRETILAARWADTDRVSAGPFRLAQFDRERGVAILEKNEYFKGTHDGTKPMLDRIVYREVTPASMFAELESGEIDVLHGITGASAIETALSFEDSGDYKAIRYDSDGCDALLFRCNSGPTQYEDVRRGIAYLLDREELTEVRFDDYADTVYAPYGEVLRVFDFIESYAETYLEKYAASAELAEACFIRAGFILGEDGQPYTSGIRYKEVGTEGGELSPRCIYVDGRYLMPLIIDWCTYEGSELSSYLRFMMTETTATDQTGISFVRSELSFEEYLSYLYRDASEESAYLSPKYNMFDIFYSFGTVYDVSVLYASDPTPWENLSGITDEAFLTAAAALSSGVNAGDDAVYNENFARFCALHNRLLPELPLYSAVTVDVFSTKVNGYDPGTMKNIGQTVLKCSVGK